VRLTDYHDFETEIIKVHQIIKRIKVPDELAKLESGNEESCGGVEV